MKSEGSIRVLSEWQVVCRWTGNSGRGSVEEGDDCRLSGQHSKPEVGLDGILQMIESEKREHFPK